MPFKIAVATACLAVGANMMDRAGAPFSLSTVVAAICFIAGGAVAGALFKA